MKFINSLVQDLNKTLINPGFVAAVILTSVLCFTAPAYTDQMNDKSYSILESYFSFSRDFVSRNSDFASVKLFRNGLSGYISMFIPIIVAFPFMVCFCSERNNGYMRFSISRTGRLRFYFSKFFASFLGGGLAVLIGMMLFGIILWVTFPSLSSYNMPSEMAEIYVPYGTVQTVIRQLLSAFLYGAFSTLPAFFISSFCRNPYIITCLPFMLVYIWTTGINKIISNAVEHMDYEVYERVNPFRPDSVRNLAFMNLKNVNPEMKQTLIFNSVYLFILLLGYIAVMEHHTDKGN